MDLGGVRTMKRKAEMFSKDEEELLRILKKGQRQKKCMDFEDCWLGVDEEAFI